MNIAVNRRDLLKGAGALVIGFDILNPANAQAPTPDLPGDLKIAPKVSSWLRIEAGGKVRLLVGKVEIGQGILTAVAQLCADELAIDMSRLEITSGDTRLVPDEGVTAGSFSMPNCGSAVRAVSADARQILFGLAAKKLGVGADKLKVADGKVSAPDGKSVTYWELVSGAELEVTATGKAPLRAREDRKYVGKSIPRIDIPAKVLGGDIFIQDLRPAGMLHGVTFQEVTSYGAMVPMGCDAKITSLSFTTN